MRRLGSVARELLAICLLAAPPALAGGASDTGAQASPHRPAPGGPTRTVDIRQLHERPASFEGQRVSVLGEIEEDVEGRSFVLDGDGLFNDEVVVVVPKDARGIDLTRLEEDAEVAVSGTVRSMPLVELERELGWDLDPQLEAEYEGAQTFIVADRIVPHAD